MPSVQVDEDNISNVLSSLLNSILKQSSRKQKQLRADCTTLLEKVKSDENTYSSVSSHDRSQESRADPYFTVIYQSLDSNINSTKSIVIALEGLQRLMALGYLQGSTKADSNVYPIKKSIPNHSNNNQRRIIDVIVESLYECSSSKEGSIQLAVCKCVLTIVASVRSICHGSPLLLAVAAVHQCYLTAPDEINKITAKATLTQIFGLIFARMEYFGVQLRNLEQTYTSFVTKYIQQQKSNNSSNTNSNNDINDNKDDQEVTKNGHINNMASVSTTSDPSPSTSTSSTSTPPVNRHISRGRCGVCAVCGLSANHTCSQTKDSVCSLKCKLINLSRKDPDMKNNIKLRSKTQERFLSYERDAYCLLRSLLKLAYKTVPISPTADLLAVESKILSLHLLLSVLNHAGPIFRTSPPFIVLVKVDLVNVLLRNSAASSIDTIFSLSSSIFVALISHFKPHLHKVIGPVLESIYIPYISSPNSSFEHKLISLTVIGKICADPQTLVELFLNYDCDLNSYNTFQQICVLLEKACHASSNYANQDEKYMTKEEEQRLRSIALEALISTMKVLIHWTTKAAAISISTNNNTNNTNPSNASVVASQSSPPPLPGSNSVDQEESDSYSQSQGGTDIRPSSPSSKRRGESGDYEESINNTNGPVSPSPSSSPANATGTVTGLSSSVVDAPTLSLDGRSISSVSSPTSFTDKFQQQRQQKLTYDYGIFRFNSKPKAGIKYLQDAGLLDSTPESVAKFLHTTPQLDKTQIGDFMGEPADFNKKVLYAYVEQMDFTGLLFDDGIRLFVSGFRLPGESQKIDRMMEKFAEQYHKYNPGVFSSADTAYVLAFSVIMLNVDAHNPQVKKRMSKEEFFKNCRGIDDGRDINPIFLGDIYDRITTNEIKLKEETPASATGSRGIRETEKKDSKQRSSRFIQESQRAIKRTEELIATDINADSNSNQTDNSNSNNSSSSNSSHGALSSLSVQINGTSLSSPSSVEEISALYQRKNSSGGVDRLFYLATDEDHDVVKPMFEILWYSALGTCSVILEESDVDSLIELCLEGYRLAIRISNELDLDTARLAFVSSLRKFTLLGSSREMKAKNLQAVTMLLTIAHTDGNRLKESWIDVLQCISEVERLHLVGSARPDGDVFRQAAAASGASGGGVRSRESDSVNSQQVTRIDASAIDRVFTASANLNERAIIDFVNQIIP